MSVFIADCPRCGVKKMTFDLTASTPPLIFSYGRKQVRDYEAFCICRECHRTTIFVLSEAAGLKSKLLQVTALKDLPDSVNNYVKYQGYISQTDEVKTEPPLHLPKNIKDAFKEGAVCLSVNCYNASATMFRLCVDHATREMLPKKKPDTLSRKQFEALSYSLGYRLEWLFDEGYLPKELSVLSTCIKDDGNDGAHQGILEKEDAEDTLDFTIALLERLYTEPERLKIAKRRKEDRRKSPE